MERINKRGEVLWFAVSWLLFLKEVWCQSSLGNVSLLSFIPFPMSLCLSAILWRAWSSIPSPPLLGKGTFLDQLLFLDNDPITPVWGPNAPPPLLYLPVHHLSLQEKATAFGSQLQHLSWEDREMKCWDGKFNRFSRAINPNTTSPSFWYCQV